MNKYKAASKLFGNMAAAGEGGALSLYCEIMADPNISETSKANVLERIQDEINHLLGDTRDAINEANLKISPDGLDEILEGLKNAKASD